MNEKGCASSGLLFGGNANNGTNAGLSYANANNAPSNANANNGSRIYYNTTTPNTGRKPHPAKVKNSNN